MIKSNTPPPEAITRSYIAAFVRVLVLAAFLVTAVQSSVLAGTKYFQINNLSGSAIGAVYAVPSNSNGWGRNRLNSPLYSGNGVNIAVDTNYRLWSFRIVYGNGASKDFHMVDVINNKSITIH